MTRKKEFLQALEKNILLFDGAMGTEIQKFNPKSEVKGAELARQKLS